MSEPTIICPKCRNEIKLNESLAAPLIITKQWAKREEQIERVMQATVGMYGDMQGIAGKTLQEIEGLEIKALNDGNRQ